MQVRSLVVDELDAAVALLTRTLKWDQAAIVAREKLFGSDGVRRSTTLGAFDDQGALVGVVAVAGRWLKLLAVDEPQRRRGLGTQLLDAAQALDVTARLRVGDHPGNYLTPGVDIRYGAGHEFFAARGFRKVGVVENLRADLSSLPPPAEIAGYTLARVDAGRRERVLGWIGQHFAPVWALEAARALDGPRQALHAAYASDGAPIAFAAADGNNQGLGWFGPAGTDVEHRGKRIGESLLLRCLHDVRGLPDGGVIAWIGPKAFYEKTIGAKIDRRFIQLERPAPATSTAVQS